MIGVLLNISDGGLSNNISHPEDAAVVWVGSGCDESDEIEQIALFGTVNCQEDASVVIYQDGLWVNRTVYFDTGTSDEVLVRITKKVHIGQTSTFRLTNTGGFDYSKTASSTRWHFQPSPVISDYYAYVDCDQQGPFYIRSRDPRPPDLIVTDVHPDSEPVDGKYFVGQEIDWYTAVKNDVPSSYGNAPSSHVGYYLGTTSTDLDNRINEDVTDEIEPGMSEEDHDKYTFGPDDVGTRYIICRADYDDKVNECGSGGEVNNLRAYGPFQVIVPGTDYSGGSGTETDPYWISTFADWQQLMDTPSDWDKHFILTTDLDLQGTILSPVGPTWSEPFVGVFHGNGHIVRNADVNIPTNDYVGLFGYIASGGQIMNFSVENATITGGDYVGGLVGVIHDSTITNCNSTASVNGRDYVGGLAQLSQLGIEMYSFDSARAVSFHHKPYYPTDGYTLLVVVALAILP